VFGKSLAYTTSALGGRTGAQIAGLRTELRMPNRPSAALHKSDKENCSVFRAPGQRGGSVVSFQPEETSVSRQQRAESVSINDIPVDIANTQSVTIEPDDIPKEIESITYGLASEHPPTDLIVVLKAARR